MKTRLTIIAATVLLASQAIPTAAQEDVAALVTRVGPSVVSLRAFDARGRALGQGSGFVLEDGRIVTNTHVVRGAANVEVFDPAGALVGTTQYAVALSNTIDLAILPRMGRHQPGLPLADAEPQIGTRIIVIGAPRGLSNTVADGLVSAIRDLESQRMLQISAPLSPGSSGGPVVDLAGNVVGVSVASLRDGQNLNFAVPVAAVAVLAASPVGQIAFSTVASTSTTGVREATPLTENRLVPGEAAAGSLDFDDPLLPDNSFYDVWAFEGRAGERYSILMTSRAFDAYLQLGRMVGSRFVVVARDDDSGPGTAARIRYTLPADGEYLVRANSFRSGQTGAYTIRLDRER